MSQTETLQTLRHAVTELECHRRRFSREPTSSGCAALDALLPAGGLERGTLVDWLGHSGSGAGTLSLIAAREVAAGGGTIAVLDQQYCFYPPAARALGIDLQRLLLIRPRTTADLLWCWTQVLQCPQIAAAWGVLPRLDWREHRRLQLAAEEGGTVGLLLRSWQAQGQPTWSELQLGVRCLSTPHRPGEIHSEKQAGRSDLSNAHPPRLELAGSGNHAAQRNTAQQNTASREIAQRELSQASRRETAHRPAFRQSADRFWRVELLRCRSGSAGGQVVIGMDGNHGDLQAATAVSSTAASRTEVRSPAAQPTASRTAKASNESSTLYLAAQLAHPKTARRTTHPANATGGAAAS